jgi:TP53 regulating kinase-like protein
MMPVATNDDDFGFSGQQQQRQVNEKMKGGITAFPYFHKTTWQLLSQGAEARIWFVPAYTTITDASSSSAHVAAVCKERFPKSYRHPSLNKQLTKARIKGEVKCITKCRKNGISVPHILSVDLSGMCVFMEFIPGRTVREV